MLTTTIDVFVVCVLDLILCMITDHRIQVRKLLKRWLQSLAYRLQILFPFDEHAMLSNFQLRQQLNLITIMHYAPSWLAPIVVHVLMNLFRLTIDDTHVPYHC